VYHIKLDFHRFRHRSRRLRHKAILRGHRDQLSDTSNSRPRISAPRQRLLLTHKHTMWSFTCTRILTSTRLHPYKQCALSEPNGIKSDVTKYTRIRQFLANLQSKQLQKTVLKLLSFRPEVSSEKCYIVANAVKSKRNLW